MKNLKSKLPLIFVFLSAWFITSCSFEEEIIVNREGSGFYALSSDCMPVLRKLMFSKIILSADDPLDREEINSKIDAEIWKEFPGEIDSTIVLNEKLRAIFDDDKPLLAILEDSKFHFYGGKSKGHLTTSMNYNFENSDQLNSLFKEIADRQTKKRIFSQTNSLIETISTVIIEEKYFKRTLTYSKEEGMAPSELLEGNVYPYAIEINTSLKFDRKIKSVQVSGGYTIVEQTKHTLKVNYKYSPTLIDTVSEVEVVLK